MRSKTATSATVLLATIVVVSMVSIPGVASHENDSTRFYQPNESGGVNETDYPDEPDGHYPGQNASWNRLVAVYSVPEELYDNPNQHEHPLILNWTKTYSPFINRCQVQNLEKFHMDHGDNNSGTDTSGDEDHNLLPATDVSGDAAEFMTMDEFENKWGHTLTSNPDYNRVTMSHTEFWSKQEAQNRPDRETLDFGNADQFVVAWNDCYTNPNKPGWYRWAGVSSVTVRENDSTTSTFRVGHWTYVCECDNEQQARQKLGPPPGVNVGEGDGTQQDGQQNDQQDGQQNDQQDGQQNDQQDGQQNDQQDGQQNDQQDGQQNDSSASDENGTDTTGGDGTDVGTTTTGGDGGGGDAAGEQTATSSPTDEGQPGFGLVAAVLALLGGALLARRAD